MTFAGEQLVQQDQATFFTTVVQVLSFLFHSPLFSVIKFFAAIYVAVLIVDIVLLVILNGAQKSYRKGKRGTNLPTYAEAKRKWRRIMARLKKNEQNYFKAAILEADQMVEKVLADAGYKQPTMREKIERLKAQHVDSADILHKAHEMSVRVIQDPELELTKRQAEETLLLYEQFLDDMEIFG